MPADDYRWVLLYTKVHAESWAELNLRRQGFATLLPRVRSRGSVAPLFPRYLFAGHPAGRSARAMEGTFGVLYAVRCGADFARVPQHVIEEITGRMNANGIVSLDAPTVDPLFARRQQERLRVLEQFAAAGFRVRAA